jgi:hypothetical protein
MQSLRMDLEAFRQVILAVSKLALMLLYARLTLFRLMGRSLLPLLVSLWQIARLRFAG